ncbi:MAG TPA: TfoX/Sxy family protein [Vicinamibacterales bacterium]|nr:TfoX/Sxy family protein [Vicinamibacterales bacterium]
MFGGVGLYSEDLFFGIIASDVLYLKVDDTNREMFEQAGMKPFMPYPGRPGTMKYYAVPLAVLESAQELERWARASIAVARRAAKR